MPKSSKSSTMETQLLAGLAIGVSRTGEFSPRAFQVYGPKLVATRGLYEDRALESRFITEETGSRGLRRDIPINLPAVYKVDALDLRKPLLLYRFRNYGRRLRPTPSRSRHSSPGSIRSLRHSSASSAIRPSEESSGGRTRRHREIVADRGMDVEAQLLEVIRDLERQHSRLAIGEVRRRSSSASGKTMGARSRASGLGSWSGAG